MVDSDIPIGHNQTNSGETGDSQQKVEPLVFLDDLPVQEHVAFVDRYANDRILDGSGIKEYLRQFDDPDNRALDIEHTDTSALSPEVRQKLAEYTAQLTDLHNEVNTDDARQKLYEIASRNRSLKEGALSPEGFERVMVFDVDGTITDPTHRKPGETDSLLPGSSVFDSLIGKKREHFIPVFAAGWANLIGRASGAFERGAQETQAREGMVALIKAAIAKGIKIKLVSTNFEPFVNAFFKKTLGEDFNTNTVESFCMRKDDARASSKGDLLKKIALENPDSLVSFVGDSTSDFPITEAGDAIFEISALENESFDRKLTEDKIPHRTFRTGADIAEDLGIEFSVIAQPSVNNG